MHEKRRSDLGGKSVTRSEDPPRLTEQIRMGYAPTGAEELDRMLGGHGLPRASGLTIDGPPNVGKRTLCMQILVAALQRSEACTYVSYRDTWRRVLHKFSSFGWDVSPYLEKGILKIVDNASVLSGLDVVTETKAMNEVGRKGIVFCKNLRNTAAYSKFLSLHVQETLESAGSAGAGIGVIDSIGIRLDMIREPHKATNYLQELRIRLAEQTGLISLHLHTPASPEHKERVRIAETGRVELTFAEKEPGGMQRRIRVAAMPVPHDTEWHSFEITKSGVQIWPRQK